MTYEQAFSDGERASYRDRQAGQLRQRPDEELTPYGKAWWDGYSPRSATWAVSMARKTTPTVTDYA